MATLPGDGNDNEIIGTDDNDTIRAMGGDDIVFGGDGDDTIDGGSGLDDLSGENGDDIITGGSGKDSISGGDGKDRINGNGGEDTIVGGEGDDTLRGGSNNDNFFINEGDGDDTFPDFVLDADNIILAGFDDIESFGELETEQAGPDTLILLSEDQGLRLRNIDKDDLTAGDIEFQQVAFNLLIAEPQEEDGGIRMLGQQVPVEPDGGIGG